MTNPWKEQSLESEERIVPNPFANRSFIEKAQLQDEPGIFSPDDIPERVNLVSQNRTIIINEVSGMTFLKMEDTPSSYAGKSDYFLKVNSAEGGIELVDLEPWVVKHLYWKRFGPDIYYKQGKVGVGLHNPAYDLDVTGNINFTGDIYYGGALFVHSYDNGDGYPDQLIIGTNAAGYGDFDSASSSYNTIIGQEAAWSATAMERNTFLGYASGYSHTSGSDCVYIGDNAGGVNTTGSRNIFIGSNCFYAGTTKISTDMVAIGAYIGDSSSSGAISNSVIVGSYAAYDISTASNMVLVGYKSGYLLTSGGGHVFLGYQSGDTITTGTNGILIGYDADTNGVDYTNFIGIGYQVSVTASNQVVIGNSSISTLTFPWMATAGYLKNDASGNITGGNVLASSPPVTDNAAVRWDGTGGGAIQNSGVIIDDSNNITGVNTLVVSSGIAINTSVVTMLDVSSPSLATISTFHSAHGTFSRIVVASDTNKDAQVAFGEGYPTYTTRWSIGNDGDSADTFKIKAGSGAFSASEPFMLTTGGLLTVTDVSITTPSSVYSLNHDSFSGFVSDEHVAHTGVSITAGTGLTGGGDISTTRTLNVDVGIGDDKIVQIDHASVADNDYAKFTASGLEGRSYSEVLGDLSGQATGAFSWNSQNLTSIGTIGAATGSTIGNLTLSNGSITDSSGSISFGNENLVTTGTFGCGGPITMTQNSDTIVWSHDGSNAYMQWSDGRLYLRTTETNAISQVWVQGNGTGYGDFSIWDQSQANRLLMTCQGGASYLGTYGGSIVSFDIQYPADCPAKFFRGATSGETQEVYIHGYRAGDANRSLQIGVGVDAADTASFDGLSNYRFDGLVNAVGGFSDNGSAGIDTTFLDQDGNTITVSGGIITAKTAP